jgi:hypothetical protein
MRWPASSNSKDQDCPWGKLGSLLVKAGQTGRHFRSAFFRNRSIQHLFGFVIEVAGSIGLELTGNDPEQ